MEIIKKIQQIGSTATEFKNSFLGNFPTYCNSDERRASLCVLCHRLYILYLQWNL